MAMWHNKGLIFNKHHAQLPTCIKVDSIFRIYYSTKIDGKSHIRFFDLDEINFTLIQDCEALSPGYLGELDHAGVMPSCIIEKSNNEKYMYYTGWYLRKDVPYGHAIFISKINKDGTLRKIGPVLSSSLYDKYLVNSPFVNYNKKRKFYEMHYCRGSGWIENFPTYHIAKAISKDGFNWVPKKQKIITTNQKDEAISRVCVDKIEKCIYFSYKTKETNYKIYKKTNQGIENLNIDSNDWDNEMQCYPCIYQSLNKKYLFYNGNGYGSTGIGVAEWI